MLPLRRRSFVFLPRYISFSSLRFFDLQESSLSRRGRVIKPKPNEPASSAAPVFVKVDEVDVLLRPWLRIDGSLNRRVLDRLLGAVLGHVSERPGRRVAQVCDRFSPALQPVHCRELIDLLADIGCVDVFRVVRSCKSSLFGPKPRVTRAPASLLDDAEELAVEPTVDGDVRLGQFIGDKRYEVDFLVQCPCHPDIT